MTVAIQRDGQCLRVHYTDTATLEDTTEVNLAIDEYLGRRERFVILMTSPLPAREPGVTREQMRVSTDSFRDLRTYCAGLGFLATREQVDAARNRSGARYADHMPYPMIPFGSVADAERWAEAELRGETGAAGPDADARSPTPGS